MNPSALFTLSALILSIDFVNGQEGEITYRFDVTPVPNILSDRFGSCPIPKSCRTKCSQNLDYTKPIEVDCARIGFGPYVPAFGLYQINLPLQWNVNFSRNGIVYVQSDDFYTAEDQVPMNLTVLDLSHNSIESIDVDAFRGNSSENLTILLLQNNRLASLEPGVFSDMPKLEKLDLSHNLLISVDVFCATRIPSLASLNLANNRINTVEVGCFDAYSSLSLSSCDSSSTSPSLDLTFNRIYSYNPCAWKQQTCANGPSSDILKYNPFICNGCGTPCIELPTTEGANSTYNTAASRSCRCTDSSTSLLVLNQSYPMDSESAAWQWQNRDKFMVETSWVPDDGSLSTALYWLTDDPNSPWNTTSLNLRNQTDSVANNSAVYELDRKSSWVFCITPSGSPDERVCTTLRPPSVWSYPYNSASSVSGVLSIAFISITVAFIFQDNTP